MNEFKYLDYCTIYSCQGDLNKEFCKEACFGHVFNSVRDNSNVTYEIQMYKGTDFCSKEHKSNACIFDMDFAHKHINLLNELYPIKFTIKDYDENSVLVTLIIEGQGIPRSFHKYALTWVRYLYEYPYNVILHDAYKLKDEPEFKDESIANLFNLGIGCFCNYPRDIHQIPLNQVTEKLSIDRIRERLTEINRLNDIYHVLYSKTKTIPEKSNICNYSVYDLEYWLNDEAFEKERKPIYLEIYKK